MHDIKAFLDTLEKEETDFKQGRTPENSGPNPTYWQQIGFILHSLLDVCRLLGLQKKWRNKPIVYTTKHFCVQKDGHWEDRISGSVVKGAVVFINYSKIHPLDHINGQKVYNIGGAVKLISKLFFWKNDTRFRIFLSYQWINHLILNKLRTKVYTLCYYDLNGLSLVFSRHRGQFEFCEIQHGSIINYPPYSITPPVKIADTFFVKNQHTIDYLKNYLCKNVDCNYHLIPYPVAHRKTQAGIHIFYASTVEFNGFHPVFLSFLQQCSFPDSSLTIRLHPREKGREALFSQHLDGIPHVFDTASHWLHNPLISSTIVVSPWSSCIEDAYDNGFTTIIIDAVGKQRYQHLIDEKQCFYSENLLETITHIALRK